MPIIKEIDYKEEMGRLGFDASVEVLSLNAKPEPKSSVIPARHPDLKAFDDRHANTLLHGGEVACRLNPIGVRAMSQLKPGSRVTLRYVDESAPEQISSSDTINAVEVDTVIGPGTNPATHTLELISLSKTTDEGLWIPDVPKEDVGPLLYGMAAMPDTDPHGENDQVTLKGRHGAGVGVALFDGTKGGAFLTSRGAQSVTYGPDFLEDRDKQDGARCFWGMSTADPDSGDADAIPAPGEVLPLIVEAEVAKDAEHWARDLQIVFRSEALDSQELQAGRITPVIAEKHPDISLEDFVLTRAMRKYGKGTVLSKLGQFADMTRQVQRTK